MSSYDFTKDWQAKKDDLTVRFYEEEQFQPTEQDLETFKRGKRLIDQVWKYKSCHYASCALHASGEFKTGVHVYCRRLPEFSVCAEHRPLQHVQYQELTGSPDPIVTVSTFHGGHDYFGKRTGDSYLASPCPKCLRLLTQISPDCLVMTDLDGRGRLAKIPLLAVPFFCHPSKHNGEG